MLLLYEAIAPAMGRPPQQGVDVELIRKDGRRCIVSITDDTVTPETPVPSELAP